MSLLHSCCSRRVRKGLLFYVFLTFLVNIQAAPNSRAFARKCATFLVANSIISPVPTTNVHATDMSPKLLISRGMTEFQRGNIEESIKDFDNVISIDSRYKPFLWQRGLSLYFAQRYDECASQFRGDVIVNPQDSEESIWTVICESKLPGGFARAQKTMPILPAPDRRPIMRAAYQLFSTSSGTTSEQLLKTLLAAGDASGKNSGDFFYSRLYAGLYKEAMDEPTKALEYYRQAVDSTYGRSSGDYMASVAVEALKKVDVPNALSE